MNWDGDRPAGSDMFTLYSKCLTQSCGQTQTSVDGRVRKFLGLVLVSAIFSKHTRTQRVVKGWWSYMMPKGDRSLGCPAQFESLRTECLRALVHRLYQKAHFIT